MDIAKKILDKKLDEVLKLAKVNKRTIHPAEEILINDIFMASLNTILKYLRDEITELKELEAVVVLSELESYTGKHFENK